MVKKIKNINYRKFLDQGEINLIDEKLLREALANIKGKKSREGRALLIALYYTGARPNEVLKLKSKDIKKDGRYIILSMKGSKGGLPRNIYLMYSLDLVKELYNYAISFFPEMYLFYNFFSKYSRKKLKKNGEIVHIKEITAKLRYYFKKWFYCVIDIPPYYLRHNRFSSMALSGASDRDIQQMKGAKSIESVNPYIHLSARSSKKMARIIK